MHVQTHIMSGWCVGNVIGMTAGQRLCCLLAGCLADVDGVGRVFGQETYWDFHHVVGHNVFFAVVTSAVLMLFSGRNLRYFALYLGLFHLHLLMDFFGSGPGWGIPYFWPVSGHVYESSYVWAFYSWQNLSAAGVFLIWTIVIIVRQGRTPLELIMPSLDKKIVVFMRKIPLSLRRDCAGQ